MAQRWVRNGGNLAQKRGNLAQKRGKLAQKRGQNRTDLDVLLHERVGEEAVQLGDVRVLEASRGRGCIIFNAKFITINAKFINLKPVEVKGSGRRGRQLSKGDPL